MNDEFAVIIEYGLVIWGVLFLAFFTALALEDLWKNRPGSGGKHRG